MIKKFFVVVFFSLLVLGTKGQSFVWFNEPDEIFKEKIFQVGQIWSNKYALARGKGDAKRNSKDYNGQVVLLVAADGSVFYDDQIVDLRGNKVPLVVGVLKFSYGKKKRTIPVVAIKKKEDLRKEKKAEKEKEKLNAKKEKQQTAKTKDGLLAY